MITRWMANLVDKVPVNKLSAFVKEAIALENSLKPVFLRVIENIESVDEATAQKQFDAMIALEQKVVDMGS